VYRRSWKTPEPFPDFLPALMRMAARKGALKVRRAGSDGKPVAAQFLDRLEKSRHHLQARYDEKWSSFSPGTLLTFHMIRHVLEHDRPGRNQFRPRRRQL